MPSVTFYPDKDPETTTVDGTLLRTGSNMSWASIRDGAGTGASDNADNLIVYLMNGTVSGTYTYLRRVIILFDISSIPVNSTITGVVLSIIPYIASDQMYNGDSHLNVYASTPASNTSLVEADYSQLGATAFSTSIDYGDLVVDVYNDFIFNAPGIAAVQAAYDGNKIVKLGLREATYDAANVAPPWTFDSELASVWMWSAEKAKIQGKRVNPKLVVTYTGAPLVTGGIAQII